MEEGSNVRLVRCPKCENILPELPDFSVYQCGGCGAVLRAKKKEHMSDRLSEKSDGEMGRGDSEKDLGFSLEKDSESEIDGLERGRKKNRALSSSKTENRECANNFDQNTIGEAMNLRVDQSNEDGEGGYFSDRYTQCSKTSAANNWVHGNDHEVNTNMKRFESGNSCVGNDVKETKPPSGDFAGSLRSRPIMDQWSVERNESVAFYGSNKSVMERRRVSTFPYPDEGPSNYWPGPFHGYSEQKRIHHDLDGPSRVENLDHDRAELLRKLDELKDRLSRSCDVTEKPRERGAAADGMMPPPLPPPPPPSLPPPPPPPNHYYGHDFYVPEGPTSLYAVNVQPFAPDKHAPEPLYCNRNHGPVPSINSRVIDMQEFYPPPRNVPNEFVGYEQSYPPQRLRKPPYQPPHQYLKQPFHDPFAAQNVGFNQSALASHRHETFSHHSACSCLRCYKNWQIPPIVPHPNVSSRSPTDPINPFLHRLVSSVSYGTQAYNSRGANPPCLHSLTRQPQTRSSSDFDLDTGGLGLLRPRRVAVAHRSERVCHPIAGGAPFLTCYSCFGLLKLPRKPMVPRKNRQKVQCGACYAIILIELEKKGIVVSITSQLKKVSPEGDGGSGEMLNENFRSSHNCLNGGATNSCSDDYNNSDYDFQLTDSEPNVLSRDQRLNFGESNERQDPLSRSSSFSENEQSPDNVISQSINSNSADMPAKDDVPIPLPDSPDQKDPDNVSSNYVVSRYGMGNKSKRNGQENLVLNKSTSLQNSVKDVSVSTEMEVSFNGFLNSGVAGVTQDSADVSKEDRPRINKGNESFLAGLIKKSFRDFSRSSQSVEKGRSNIFVNGQPIPDRVVKKAEKLAGRIQPGNYWYDYRAGFWGVMGHPCIGIIPPFIEEFNYPMPENCAAGNTGVFVNGRELHQKDLDLLAGRGLPTMRDKSYVIEISGKILDEDTCEELDSLGKLAPTVEKVKHGFGMKIPRALA